MGHVRESVIQAAILDYLAARKHFYWRQNNIPIYDGNRYRSLPKHTPRGVPDIIVVKDGHAIFLEVKNADGKLTTDQKDFCTYARKAGATYELVRSIDDVQKLGL
jgi:hypothetical protein